MVGQISVLLSAENDEATRQLVAELYLNGMNVGICEKNGAEVLKQLKENSPDVVIIDAFMQHIDGLGVLSRINTMNPVKRPLIIVMSSVDNNVFQKAFMREGADYCFIKPVEPQIVAERIVQLLSWKNVGVVANSQKSQELEIAISEILHQVGIPAKVKGFRYLRDAILLVIENPEIINYVTTILYPAIAEKYNSDPASVERAMRYAVKLAWDKEDVIVFKTYFNYATKNPKRPTNSEFICRISDDLRFKRKMHMKLDGAYKSVNNL